MIIAMICTIICIGTLMYGIAVDSNTLIYIGVVTLAIQLVNIGFCYNDQVEIYDQVVPQIKGDPLHIRVDGFEKTISYMTESTNQFTCDVHWKNNKWVLGNCALDIRL